MAQFGQELHIIEKINFINPYIAEKICDMANNLDLMDIKQIINLLIDGLSNRKISDLLGYKQEYCKQLQ